MDEEAPVATWTSCPICGGREQLPHVEFARLAFVRCARCSTVYKSRESADLRSEDFYEQQYHTGRASRRHQRFEHRVRKASNQIRAGLEYTGAKRLLDIGCSMGYTLEAGRRLGLAASGLDVSKFAVDHCAGLGFDVKQGSLEQLDWDDESFDVVVMKHVLEHTPHPRRALSGVARVLRPGGAVIVTVPNLRYWKSLLFRRTYRYFRPDDLGKQHYVYYTPKTLSALMAAAGFEVAKVGKVQYRSRGEGRSLTSRVFEPLRFLGLLLWHTASSVFYQRREIQLIATKPMPPAP